MSDTSFQYGPHSPFSDDERPVIEAVYDRVVESGHREAAEIRETIVQQVRSLEQLGEVLAQYPSPLHEQRLGRRQRGLDTLLDSLSHTNFANFEFHLPTRAILGRAIDMAETNFYRLLHHVCRDILEGGDTESLADQATQRLRVCLYTKLAEEVLSTIAADEQIDRDVRREAINALAKIWGRRVDYRVAEFFPVLEAAWEARQRTSVVGGTLGGTHELYELFKEGCDPAFVEYFTRPNPGVDEIEAFREFLFGASSEELTRLAETMVDSDVNVVSLPDMMKTVRDNPIVFYEFFKQRHLLANARRLANHPGPKRTAEGYVMIHFLRQAARAHTNREDA